MSAQIRQTGGLGDLPAWQAEVAQLLEEHHLVAWSPRPGERLRFGQGLGLYLESFEDTEVCWLQGEYVADIFSFCNQLERVLGGERIRRSVDARGGIVDALRRRRTQASGKPYKRRFYVWSEAHVLLRHDHKLLGRLVDAIAGVAAEAEYASEDMLLIHRAIFVGAPSLDVYAEEPTGQFRTWLSEKGEVPLWRVVSGLREPPVLRYRIEGLPGEGEGGLAPPVVLPRRAGQPSRGGSGA